jgi:predicted RNA-binding protein
MNTKLELYKRFVIPFWNNKLKLSPPPIELVAFNPQQTLKLMKHPLIKSFRQFITYEFSPKKKYKIALIVPCDAYKPYSPKETKSKLYKKIYKLTRENIHIITLSDPLAVQPQEFHDFIFKGQKIFYDNIGLFKTFNEFLNLKWDKGNYNKCIKILAETISFYFSKNKNYYKKIIALCIKGRPEFDVVALTNKMLNNKIIVVPSFPIKENFSTIDDFFQNNQKIYIKKEVMNELKEIIRIFR